jgi:hypothetical protein
VQNNIQARCDFANGGHQSILKASNLVINSEQSAGPARLEETEGIQPCNIFCNCFMNLEIMRLDVNTKINREARGGFSHTKTRAGADLSQSAIFNQNRSAANEFLKPFH